MQIKKATENEKQILSCVSIYLTINVGQYLLYLVEWKTSLCYKRTTYFFPQINGAESQGKAKGKKRENYTHDLET